MYKLKNREQDYVQKLREVFVMELIFMTFKNVKATNI